MYQRNHYTLLATHTFLRRGLDSHSLLRQSFQTKINFSVLLNLSKFLANTYTNYDTKHVSFL